MTDRDDDDLIADYLRRLDIALRSAGVPENKRKDLVEDVLEHIEDARLHHPDPTAASTREILDRIGTPTEIAAEAMRTTGGPRRRGLPRPVLIGMTAALVA